MKPKCLYKKHDIEVWHGNNQSFKDLGLGSDLILTDPPYGINKSWKRTWHGSNGETKLWGEIPEWDKDIDFATIAKLTSSAFHSIIWGGNFYPLGPASCYFIWDKLQSNRGADCELAWTNLDIPPKCFRMSRIDAYFNKAQFKKKHPNEKPIQLMQFCIEHTKPYSILDPYMGVGATLIAARLARIPARGIEMNLDYCEEAIRRLKIVG